jgi:hypothetical protein
MAQHTQKTAKQLAEQFYAELEIASTSSDKLKALVKKWYANNAEQNEAGEQPTRGLEAIIARESVFYDNYFDFTIKIDPPLTKILSIHGGETVTFTHQIAKLGLKGAGVISKF